MFGLDEELFFFFHFFFQTLCQSSFKMRGGFFKPVDSFLVVYINFSTMPFATLVKKPK